MLTPESNIRVIHFSTGSVGGAGLAARRLNAALIEQGVDSKFCTPKRKNYSPGLGEVDFKVPIVNRGLGAFYTLIQRRFHSKTFFSLFSASLLTNRRLSLIAKNKRTILHFHNWYNLVTQNQMINLANFGYSVVVTMHDERFFTGGCHYALECEKFKSDRANCPRLPTYFKKFPKRNLVQTNKSLNLKHPNIHFIAPSNWIKSEALNSKILNKQNIYHIPNSLGFNLEIREMPSVKLRTNSQKLVLGLAGMDPNHYLKGGSILSELESVIQAKSLPIVLKYLNQIPPKTNPNDEFWSTIDFLLSLSQADNSPNVIHEAKSLGIPIIATSVGGIPELLNVQIDKLLPPNISGEALANILMDIFNSMGDSMKVDSSNEQFLNYVKDSVSEHINLYTAISRN